MLPPMTDQMKAIVVERLGPPDVMELRGIPVPQPGEGEIRIEVEAVGINFADVLAVAGEYLTRTRVPYTPGMEFAGIVESLGEGVDNVKVGQRVACLGGSGALARYAVAKALDFGPVPV